MEICPEQSATSLNDAETLFELEEKIGQICTRNLEKLLRNLSIHHVHGQDFLSLR